MVQNRHQVARNDARGKDSESSRRAASEYRLRTAPSTLKMQKHKKNKKKHGNWKKNIKNKKWKLKRT